MTSYKHLLYLLFAVITAVTSRPNIDLFKDSNPCNAAKLEVHARNVETGDWSVKLGNMEGKISHRSQNNEIAEEESGQWHAGIYNNGNGCADDVIYDNSGEETEQPVEEETEGPVWEETEGPVWEETEGPVWEETEKPEEFSTELQNGSYVIPGYTHIENIGYYKYHSNGESWSEAKRVCESESAHLVVIDSLDEKLEVLYLAKYESSLAKYEGHDQFFIGARSEDGGSTYVTVLGSPLETTDYLKWGPGEPSTDWGQEDCIALLRTGYLNNENCHRRMPYVCEIEE